MSYPRQPASPATGYFPTSPSTPLSFTALQQQSPRDAYNMYAEFRVLSGAGGAGRQAPRAAHGTTPSSPLKRFFWKS